MMSQITLNGIREKKLFLIIPECFLHCLVADGSLFSINLFLVQFLVISILLYNLQSLTLPVVSLKRRFLKLRVHLSVLNL